MTLHSAIKSVLMLSNNELVMKLKNIFKLSDAEFLSKLHLNVTVYLLCGTKYLFINGF